MIFVIYPALFKYQWEYSSAASYFILLKSRSLQSRFLGALQIKAIETH